MAIILLIMKDSMYQLGCDFSYSKIQWDALLLL